MLIDANSLEINGTKMAQYLLEVEYGYNKVWASDSGRNMASVMSGTYLGVVVKLKLKFRKTTQTELEDLAQILDTAFQTTTYYDPKLKRANTITTYTGDWATLNKHTFSNVAKANESFNISVIAIAPRGE